jgi:hypothetical protein
VLGGVDQTAALEPAERRLAVIDDDEMLDSIGALYQALAAQLMLRGEWLMRRLLAAQPAQTRIAEREGLRRRAAWAQPVAAAEFADQLGGDAHLAGLGARHHREVSRVERRQMPALVRQLAQHAPALPRHFLLANPLVPTIRPAVHRCSLSVPAWVV